MLRARQASRCTAASALTLRYQRLLSIASSRAARPVQRCDNSQCARRMNDTLACHMWLTVTVARLARPAFDWQRS